MTDRAIAGQLTADRGAIEEALRRAAAAARREYVRAGLSMPVWRGGRLVLVDPEELAASHDERPAAGRDHQTVDGNGTV